MDEKPTERRFSFTLSTLFALVAACAVGAYVLPPALEWLFPPKPVDSDMQPIDQALEFDRLRQQWLDRQESSNGELDMTITHGAGLTITEQDRD